MSTLPPPLADLATRLGLDAALLDPFDSARATAALDDATALVLAEVPASKALAWTDDPPKVVTLVVLKAARREFENPRGVYQEAQGEHSIGLKDTTGVYLTAAEVAPIRRAAGVRGTSSVRTPQPVNWPVQHGSTLYAPVDGQAALPWLAEDSPC